MLLTFSGVLRCNWWIVFNYRWRFQPTVECLLFDQFVCSPGWRVFRSPSLNWVSCPKIDVDALNRRIAVVGFIFFLHRQYVLNFAQPDAFRVQSLLLKAV